MFFRVVCWDEKEKGQGKRKRKEKGGKKNSRAIYSYEKLSKERREKMFCRMVKSPFFGSLCLRVLEIRTENRKASSKPRNLRNSRSRKNLFPLPPPFSPPLSYPPSQFSFMLNDSNLFSHAFPNFQSLSFLTSFLTISQLFSFSSSFFHNHRNMPPLI